jgi:hypothetical protein
MPQIHILPQQPNYTLNKSLAATTNRAPTKEQTSQRQKKALTAMIMTIVYPGKELAEDVRKEQASEPEKCQQ